MTVRHHENRGLGTVLNEMIDGCETEFLARMDADDVCHPERLQRQMAFLARSPETVMVGTHIRFLFDAGVLQAWTGPLEHGPIYAALCSGRFSMSHPTIVFRTAPARSCGGYRIGGAGEDMDFLLRMCETGRAANLPDFLYDYRLHSGSISTRSRKALHFGYAYARTCAERRRQGQVEPELDEFRNTWVSRGLVEQCREYLDIWAESQYRAGMQKLAAGRRLPAIGPLAGAACLRPLRTVRRMTELAHLHAWT
jgi:glycosyltransferase involved in cell wall biosynthesis